MARAVSDPEDAMEYMMLIYESEHERAARNDPQRAEAYWGSWTAYVQALAQSGIMKGGNGLQPPETATTVRLRAGRREVQDGPYADSKEQLGGYFILDVPDLDVALDWAARCPAAPDGSVEIRPLMVMQPG
jgi:hypothetical protein